MPLIYFITQEELQKLTDRNRKELLEEYNKGRYYGASANVTSYERQLTASTQSRQKKSSSGDGTCARGNNHNSRDIENRRLHEQNSVKRIPMPLRYNVS